MEPLIKATPDMRTPTTSLSPKINALFFSTNQPPEIRPPLYIKDKFHSPMVATIEGFHYNFSRSLCTRLDTLTTFSFLTEYLLRACMSHMSVSCVSQDEGAEATEVGGAGGRGMERTLSTRDFA